MINVSFMLYYFSYRNKQESLLARMQLENKKIHETFEDIDLNDMVRFFLFFMIQVEYSKSKMFGTGNILNSFRF